MLRGRESVQAQEKDARYRTTDSEQVWREQLARETLLQSPGRMQTLQTQIDEKKEDDGVLSS